MEFNSDDVQTREPDVATLLLEACSQAGVDFPASVAWLKPRITTITESGIIAFVAARLAVPDPGTVACTIYLLAQTRSPDLAAAAGWYALDLGCDSDEVIIALADILQVQAHPRQTAAAMMHERASERRSTPYLIKLADHYRTAGRAFLAEDVLRDQIRRGRNDLVLRLAEHWVEWEDWASGRTLLRSLEADQESPYSNYLRGRCAASLLLENEVIERLDALASTPEPGPRYAALLRCVWDWRVGDPATAARACPDGDFSPLLARDAASLRRATPTSHLSTGAWREIGSRHDLPNILGIGMQRTATTWLWRHLTKHPDVAAPSFKELVFFSGHFASPNRPGSDLLNGADEAGDNLYWEGPTRSLLHYRRMYGGHKNFRIDISPSYGELPEESVARVREILGPDVKIILSVRDPVERSWSNLKYNLTYSGEHPLQFSYAERIAAYRNVATLRRCDYATALRTWRRYFTEIMVIFMDDIIARPDETLIELNRFIGLTGWANAKAAGPANSSDIIDMPREDRLFLFGLHQPTYDAAEAALGGPACGWRQRQLELLNTPAAEPISQ